MNQPSKDQITFIRRTEYGVERYTGQTPLNGRQYRVNTTIDEVYDFADPSHRKDLLEMMAMTVFENGDYDVNALNTFMDEVKSVVADIKFIAPTFKCIYDWDN